MCVGLDSDFGKIPDAVRLQNGFSVIDSILEFNIEIVEATKDLVCAYKPNIAFYAQYGDKGMVALNLTVQNIHMAAPNVPVILDAKRADIGNTNVGYVDEAFDYVNVDAITVHPYLGQEALQPFLDRKEKGIIVLCRTSNPGAGEFQDIRVEMGPILIDNDPRYRPLYQIVALRVAKHWNTNGNCGLVVGATYPDELREVRALAGDMPILIPGIGAQGGDLEATVKAAGGEHMIVNSSRGIIFASKGEDYAEAARRETQKLHEQITQCRGAAKGAGQ